MKSSAAAVLAETRAYGIELAAEGGELRIHVQAGVLTPALRAKIVANKPELLALLRRQAESAAADYDRAVRTWNAEYVTHLAHAFGYPAEIVRAALEVLARQPRGRGFRVGKDIIHIEMGDGLEVRLHRTPQAWLPATP